MYQIVCTDVFGQPHDVPADEMHLSTGSYGIYITVDTVLLVQDKASGLWQFPGGFVDKIESPVKAMVRGVENETGLIVSSQAKLVRITEEDFFDVYSNTGSHITRMFYLIRMVDGGVLDQSGNGVEIAKAEQIHLDKVRRFSDKDMKKKYREILLQAIEMTHVT